MLDLIGNLTFGFWYLGFSHRGGSENAALQGLLGECAIYSQLQKPL
jgi:hypothetical protein